MQISTREEDFIVDTLALRDELEDMNEVFTDRKLRKCSMGRKATLFGSSKISLYTCQHV